MDGECHGVADEHGETRGTSMVEKHFQKLQQEKEEAASAKLQGLMPLFGSKVRIVALRESAWTPEKAALLLRRFQVANASRLRSLHKKRKRILTALAKEADDRDKDRARQISDSCSVESGSAGSRNHPVKKSRRSKKDGRSKKEKKRQRKKDEKSKKGHASVFGKHGIVRESDYHSKRAEFVKWAMDVKGIDTEACSRNDEMKLFADYAEDFNTGTLPHTKYYDLEVYRKKKARKLSKKDDATHQFSFNDEEERRMEKERKRREDHDRRVQEAYFELKTSEKATDMKQQELLRMQMKLAYKTGDTLTAGKLAERLKPDDSKDPGKTDLPDEEW